MRHKKIFSFFATICAFTLTIGSLFLLSACGTSYHSQSGTLSDMAGTYQLTTYTQKEDGNEVDRIAQWHVKAYLVVGLDGRGYYYYEDDKTDFWYDTVLINYNQEDNSDLYKSIQWTRGVNQNHRYINRQKPGNGYEPTAGFNVNNKTFNYFIPDYQPNVKGIVPSYYTNVVYTKISDDTNLDKVASETGKTLDPLPTYELKNLNGVLIFHAGQPNSEIVAKTGETSKGTNPEYNKYKYYIVDFNAVSHSANIYYELKNPTEDNAGAQTQTNVPITVSVNVEANGNRTVTCKFLNQSYSATIPNADQPPFYLSHTVWSREYVDTNDITVSSEIYNNSFEKYQGSGTIEEIIADPINATDR